jgi:hypothetical protein
MKFMIRCLVAAGLVAFLNGCATGDSAHYTASQRAAQGAGYDPTYRSSVSRY